MRLKGQEVVVSVLRNGATVKQLTSAVKSLDMEFEREVLKENYLGQTAASLDDVYICTNGDMSLHTDAPETLDFLTFLNDRSQRRIPNQQINIKATYNWPNGERRIIVATDCFFGTLSFNAAGRTEYVEQSVPFSCSSAPVRS